MKLIMQSALNYSLCKLFCCLLLLFSAAACEKSNEVDISAEKPVENINSAKLILVSGITGRQGAQWQRNYCTPGLVLWSNT